ncbi:MAG TPA: hypothetical protein VFW40_08475 [Capsulimonadaceae bacterium]|nr:hypothetical protein [Capsulimonadaceae bacterium]
MDNSDESFERLYNDLWERVNALCKNLPPLEFPPLDDERVFFPAGTKQDYDLTNYNNRRYFLRKKLTRVNPGYYPCQWAYTYDDKGRPDLLSLQVVGPSGYAPFINAKFIYSETEVVVFDIYCESQILAGYQRVTLEGGEVVTFQRMNSAVGYPGFKVKKRVELIEQLKAIGHHLVYIYNLNSEGKRVSGRGFERHGEGRQYMETTYTYDQSGKYPRETKVPTRVVRMPKPDHLKKTSKNEPLVDALVSKIADKAMEALRKSSPQEPWVLVQLAYQAGEDYLPTLYGATTKNNPYGGESGTDLITRLINKDTEIELHELDFKPELRKLVKRMEASEDYEPGTTMLRRAAALVTERAPKELNTAPGFLAFAMDWDNDGHEVEAVLKECGASSEALELWKSTGWL